MTMILYVCFTVVTTSLDCTDPFWMDVQSTEQDMSVVITEWGETVNQGVVAKKLDSNGNLQDSGLGSSLSCTLTVDVAVDLNVSRESGELTDEDDSPFRASKLQLQGVRSHHAENSANVTAPCQEVLQDNGYIRGSLYVAASMAERLVLEEPPAPVLGKLAELPDSRATFITDRVGAQLTKHDRVMVMQNNVPCDFWQVA